MRATLVTGSLWILSIAVALASAANWGTDATIRLAANAPDAEANVDVSADGRFVAFASRASLLPHSGNGLEQVYVWDRTSGAITLESASIDGSPANGSNQHPRLSGDGRYLVFASVATNLMESQPKPLGAVNVILRDRDARTTIVVSTGRHDASIATESDVPDISDDGAVVVFESTSTELVPGVDRNDRARDVYLFDVQRRITERVSVDDTGQQLSAGSSGYASVSGDGRYVAFTSSAPLTAETLPPAAGGRFNPLTDRQVFLRDRVLGRTTLVSHRVDGRAPNGASYRPTVSGDGRHVAFVSRASDLGPPDRNRVEDVYVFDTTTKRTLLVSRGARGGSADGRSFAPVFSADGRFVVFASDASNLVCGRRCPSHLADLNLVTDIYRFDVLSQSVERVSGTEANRPQWWEASGGPAVDRTGNVIAFSSRHPVDADDFAHDFDLFIHCRNP